jgi:NAD(P)-binding Rossmann-like domain
MTMRSYGVLFLWGVLLHEIFLQGRNRGGFALAFEIQQSISSTPRHGWQPSSSFPFPTSTSSSSLMTDVPSNLRPQKPSCFRRTGTRSTTTELSLFRRIRRLFRRGGKNKDAKDAAAATAVPVSIMEAPPAPEVQYEKISPKKRKSIEKGCSICIIGGGVSGLAAALTAVEKLDMKKKKIILLEASPKVGGRVQSDTTADGYTLDRGFAVFIEEYPMAKKILDYDGACCVCVCVAWSIIASLG